MKNQALFSSKAKSKQLTCRLLQFLLDALKIVSLIYFVVSEINISTKFR